MLTQIFAANTKYFTPYWIGGPKNISYVGSSMHLFQNLKFSTASRISQHIRHADLHRQCIPHKCKQPLLYGSICHDIHKLFFLPITYVYVSIPKHSMLPLQKIELNIIRAVNSSLNVTGRGIPKTFSGKNMKKIRIKNNRASKRRRTLNRLTSPHIFDKELSGKPTMFFYEPGKYWYNHCALFKSNKKIMHVDVLNKSL